MDRFVRVSLGAVADELLTLIREQTRGLYDPIGRIGEDAHCVAYLGRDLETEGLVVLRLEDGGGEAEEMTLTVGQVLDASIPADGNRCPACSNGGHAWGMPCPKCGHTVVHAGVGSDLTTEDLLEAITDSAGDEYLMLGALATEPEGTVFFARDKDSTRVVGLGLHREADDHFELVQIWAEPTTAAKATGPTGATPSEPPTADEGTADADSASVAAGSTDSDLASALSSDSTGGPDDADAHPQGAPPPEYQGATPWASKAPPTPQRGGPSPMLLGGAVVGLVALGAVLFWPRSPGAEETPPPSELAEVDPTPEALGDSAEAVDSSLMAVTTPEDESEPSGAVAPSAGSESTPNPSTPPAATTGRVRVEGAFPSGTRISVDGSVVNGTSFARPPGRYTVAVAAPGYFPTTTELRVEAGTTQSWRPELRRLERTVDPEPEAEQEEAPPPTTGTPSEAAPTVVDAARAINQVLERYRAALQSHDMGNLRDAFFGIPSSEEQRWEPFFEQFNDGRFTDLVVGLDAQQPRFFDGDTRAEVDFALTLRYTDPNGAPPPNAIPLRAVLRGSADGWLLLRIDPQG